MMSNKFDKYKRWLASSEGILEPDSMEAFIKWLKRGLGRNTGLYEQIKNAKVEEYTSLSDKESLEIIEKFINELKGVLPKKDEKNDN